MFGAIICCVSPSEAAATAMSKKELEALASSAMLGAGDEGRDASSERAARRAGKEKERKEEKEMEDSPLENEGKKKEQKTKVKAEIVVPTLKVNATGREIVAWAKATSKSQGGKPAPATLFKEMISTRTLFSGYGNGRVSGYESRGDGKHLMISEITLYVHEGGEKTTLVGERINDVKFSKHTGEPIKLATDTWGA